ncbi:MAG: DUF2236 domain-containing protein [Streptosporangiales bacterium]|nr:DUF2236 domain-containing protein [Streptosporangiales bacterium]
MTATETLIVQPPESATWQVHIDRTMWIAGVRALMLQALHPRAMWGVWQNSDFMHDPFGRLQRTADFVGVTTFGHPDEASELGARVRGIHRALPEVPEPLVTGALRVVRRSLTLVPEPLHDRVFQPHTRAMLARARGRLGGAGYDLRRGLIGLRDPARRLARPDLTLRARRSR